MRWLFAGAVAIVLMAALPAYASVDCENTSLKHISTFEERIDGVAFARAMEKDGRWQVAIDRSSRFSYFSNETLQWIVFRECYLADQKASARDRDDLYLAETADCWAARELRDERGDRALRTVEYDLEVLNNEASDSDWRTLLGPQRSPYLFKCL